MTNQEIVQNHDFDWSGFAAYKNKTMFSKDGILYSYDTHYPLMWKTNGIIFANTRYYSHTTSGHSSLASQRADCTVKLPYTSPGSGFASGYFSARAIFDFLMDEVVEIQSTISNIKRENTKKEQLLRERLNEINHTFKLLKKGG